MPTINRFYGILIRMFHDEHGIPHFHAKYGEHQAVSSTHGRSYTKQSCSKTPTGWTESSRHERSLRFGKLLAIVAVKVINDHTLTITLDDGRTVTRDYSALFYRARGVLRQLRDPRFFRKVRVVDGALAWPGELDLCPLTTIYGPKWHCSNVVPATLSI